MVIPRGALGKCRPAMAVARFWQIFRAQESGEPAISWQQAAFDGIDKSAAQPFAFSGAQALRQALDGTVKPTALGIGHEHRFDLRQRAFDARARLDAPAAMPRAGW